MSQKLRRLIFGKIYFVVYVYQYVYHMTSVEFRFFLFIIIFYLDFFVLLKNVLRIFLFEKKKCRRKRK